MSKPIFKIGLAVAIVTAGFLAPAAIASAKELKLAHFVPARHHIDAKVMRPMAEQLAKLSGGKFTIKIYPGGALGAGPREQFKRAINHVADITMGLQGYTSQQFPRTLLAELPNIGTSPQDVTKRMWKALSHIKMDYKDVKILGLWMTDFTVLVSKKPIRTLGDLKGLKIRTPSALAGGLLKKWGAIPVPMPAPRIYQQFQTGVIDAVFIGGSGIRSFKLQEIGKYYTIGLPLTFTTQFLVMNKGAYKGLTGSEKKQLDSLTGLKFSLVGANAYEKAGISTMKFVVKGGGKIIKLAPAEARKFSDAANAYVKKVIAAKEKAGIKAKVIVGAMKGSM